jgi:hypothetical protein
VVVGAGEVGAEVKVGVVGEVAAAGAGQGWAGEEMEEVDGGWVVEVWVVVEMGLEEEVMVAMATVAEVMGVADWG